MKIKQALKECELFSGLSDAELEKLASSAVEKQYEAGTILFQEGDSAEELFVLQEGRVALQMMLPKADGQPSRSITIDVVAKNDPIGWSAIVAPYKYTLTAVCLKKAQTLSISGTKLRQLLRDDPQIGYGMLKGLVNVVVSRLEETRRVLISERSSPPLGQARET